MSHYGQPPPPGAYASPNQGPQQPQAPAPNPFQSGTYQPPQTPSAPSYGPGQQQPTYGPQAGNYGGTPQPGAYGGQQPTYGPPQGPHKPGGFSVGKMYDQALTSGKPMFNKLGKTISSKLGSKPLAPPPQHLQSYENYQQHQQQWGQQPQQPQYGPAASGVPPQFASPASGHSGQNNYFPQQGQQPGSQVPVPPSYGPSQAIPGQQTGVTQSPQSPVNMTTPPPNPPMGTPSVPPHPNQAPTVPSHPSQQQQAFNPGTPNIPQHPDQAQPAPNVPQHPQQTFNPGSPSVPQHPNMSQQQISNPETAGVLQHPNQQPQTFNAGSPNVPQHPNQQQQQVPSPAPQQQPFVNHTPPPQQYNNTPTPAGYLDQQQQQQQQQIPQSGNTVPQVSSPVQAPNQFPPSASPPPSQFVGGQQQQQQPQPPQQPQSPPPQQQQGYPQPQQQRQQSTASTKDSRPQSASTTNFVAELPADMGNMHISEESKSPTSTNSPYQAYQPPGQATSPSSGFAIPRRAVSTSSLPLADPWRIADPSTELPTREFYLLADLVFDGLDRRYEPANTGLLEASKMLESWRAQQLPDEVSQLFAYDSYTAFAKLWSLEGIPHVMVPLDAHLRPQWDFEAQAHGHMMRVPPEFPPAGTPYPRYMPALNRAGWYKYLFLEAASEPEALSRMLSLFCSDTYRPGILQHPDVQKQDQTEIPALASRAKSVRTILERVCQETAAAMQASAQSGVAQGMQQPQAESGGGGGGMNQQDAAAQMQAMKMQQQMSQMMAQQMVAGGASIKNLV